jgi:plastocyanin
MTSPFANNWAKVAAIMLLFGLCRPLSDFAASTTVTVGSPTDRFSPAVVTINAGDQVIWNWASTFHSSTSGTNGVHGDDNGVPSGLWDSGLITSGLPHTFTNTFSAAGIFAYYCSQHYNIGMTGEVIVVAAALPPLIAITNPVSGAVFAAPADVTIRATATNGSAAVTNVQFLVGPTVLANVTAAPFAATADNLAAGSYTLSAIAEDSNGVTATNSVAISVVTPLAVALTNSEASAGTNFQFSYLVNTGLSYVVQFSTNLAPADWISLVTNVAASNPAAFVDLHATNNPAFYRVGRLPNP